MSESWKTRFAEFKRKAKENLERKVEWCERELVSRVQIDGKVPFPSQGVRVYEAVENGTKRILFADATGFGKTYVAAMILGLLNKRKGKKHKALLIAPEQSLKTAWKESAINSYMHDLNLIGRNPLRIAPLAKENLEDVLKENDIICANYHKFNCASSDRYLQAVLDVSKDIDLVFFDESQHFTSFGKRGINLKQIIDATRKKRVLLFSATPGKNGLEDLGIPLHILDERFPFAPFDYESNKTAIMEMIAEGKWFNSDRDVVKQLFNLPDLTIHDPYYCEIGDYYAKRYLNVWKDGDLDVGSKIALLRKNLLLGKLKSEEGRKELEELLESFPKDDAVITFTHLKTGIDKNLFNFLERFYGKGKVAMINGDVKEVKDRIEISEKFTNGEYRVLANSLLTMGEGVPCTTGERAARLLFLEIPYNHGQLNQGIGRPYRPGQKHPVDVYYILGKNEWLNEKMIEIKESGELERKYESRFPSDWEATLIDFDIYRVLQAKDIIDRERVRNALSLTRAQQAIMSFNESSASSLKEAEEVGILRSLPRKQKRTKNPFAKFTQFGWKLYGIGEEELLKISSGSGRFNKESRHMFEAHSDENILDTTAGDTARLIRRVVEGIETRREKQFEKLLDLGCGTGVVSRVLEREMTNIDLDERMLGVCEKYGLGPCKKGRLTNLPLGDNQFDLATASYVLFYLKQYDGDREIEKAVMEINRVLKYNGYFVTSLIRTTKQKDIEEIKNIMHWYGFNVLVSDFFKGYRTDGRKSNFRGAYLLVGRKEVTQKNYVDLENGEKFEAFAPMKYMISRGGSKKGIRDSTISPENEDHVIKKVNSAEFRNNQGISLDKVLRGLEI